MDYKKIASMIVKIFYKNIPSNPELLFGYYGEKIGVVHNGHRVFLIDARLFPFDMEKLLGGRTALNIKKLIPDENNYETATLTNELKKLEAQKKTIVKIENANGSAWVDEDYLKEYGKGVQFKICKKNPRKTPVIIYELDEIVGIVLPVNVSEEV